MKHKEADVLIIGGGIAGLMAAEYLSSHKNVIVITKFSAEKSNSFLAQGGISAAIDEEDSWAEHFLDTLKAGRHHNDQEAVKQLVKEGESVVRTLTEWGVNFDRHENGSFILGKEGGHNRNRIVHAGGDQTGKKVIEALIRRVSKNVKIVTHHYAVDLIIQDHKCIGVSCKDDENQTTIFQAKNTILAGGGYAGIYGTTSNAFGSDGSVLCMAYRAGVELSDLEFVQFHPTLLSDRVPAGLITEAVRGQGGILINSSGVPFMKDIHPLKDLAPRDIVSRRLFQEIHEHGEKVFLDISSIKDFRSKFPGVTMLCENAGIDLDKGLIPVSPGAHFTMGGIVTDQSGKTSLRGLYAVGECANTGVHGANRLASNSLLEGAVFAKKVANSILSSEITDMKPATFKRKKNLEHKSIQIDGLLQESEIHLLMDKYAGIVRSKKELMRVAKTLNLPSWRPDLIKEPLPVIKRFNMQTIAWLTVTSCLKREESRGSHYRKDFPSQKKEWDSKKIIRSLWHDESIIAEKTVAGIFN
ncbi:L-aspartate oxidase [Fictibacillus phosphorivorans]|uniref:L-aspartate oxidase n=1 Tax=Fictibacillus phosphorivorans TaxID=1221500 RepID=UPI0035EA6C4D